MSQPANARTVARTLFFVAMAAGFGQFGAIAALNDVAKFFGHVSASGSLRSTVGLSGSALGLGLGVLRLASLAALPLAARADHRGRPVILRQTLFAGLVLTALAALSPSYWFFVLCFALARPMLSAASTIVQVITVEFSSATNRIHRLAVMAAGAGIGAGLSAVLHGIIRGPDSFRWLFAAALVPALGLWRPSRAILEPVERVSVPASARLGAVPRTARGPLAIVASVVFSIGMMTGPANGFAFVYGEGVLKISPHLVALVVALSALTGLGGLVLSRRLSRTLGRRITIALGVLLLAATTAFAYSGGRASFIAGYLVGVGAVGLLTPATSALSTEIFLRSVRATAAGWVAVAGVLGATTGLAVFGWISDRVHAHASTGLRTAAFATFLPLLPTLLLLRRLPEKAAVELD